jgi:hypothetical protein
MPWSRRHHQPHPKTTPSINQTKHPSNGSLGHVMATMTTLTTAGLIAIGLTATPAHAAAANCPNAAFRAQSNSTHLPDCRAYELVTNPFKEGFAPLPQAYTDDGAFSYRSSGNFADNGMGGVGNQYLATRSPTGWSTTAPAPSGPTYVSTTGSADALSADLRSSIWQMRLPGQATNVNDLYLRGPDGIFTRIGPGANPATLPPGVPGTPYTGPLQPLVQSLGVSADLSHVLFTVESQNGYPGDTSVGPTSLYEYAGTGNSRPRLVGVDNSGHQLSQEKTCPDRISSDGRVVVFSPNCGGSPRVWARINNATSIEASASECTRTAADSGGACNGPADANFVGAATDGSRVYFTTTQQLVDGDTDETNDLYECDIPSGTPVAVVPANPCAALREVSGTAVDAQVESVAAISDDGSRVYFVAHGVLATNVGANDVAAVAGDENLYVWEQGSVHLSGETRFIGKLDSDDIGTLPGRPSDVVRSQTTADGRYLVFSTSTTMVTTGAGADSDTAVDVYHYDAETGRLMRVSTATSGDGGNASGADASTNSYPTSTDQRRTAMTADGASVAFLTSDALALNDTNGTVDAYVWHDGQVSLISSGQPSLASSTSPFAWITASGTDIYFSTTAQLTANDRDTNPDVYDARVGGGFDFTEPQGCSGDTCHGPHSFPPGLSAPVSDVPVAAGNLPAMTPTFSLRPVSVTQRRRLAATGKITLTVTASMPGTVSAAATATIGARLLGVGSVRRTATRPGKTTLTLSLSKRARDQLAAAGRLTVKVVVSYSEVALTRSATLKLVKPKLRKKTVGRSSVRRAVVGAEGVQS